MSPITIRYKTTFNGAQILNEPLAAFKDIYNATSPNQRCYTEFVLQGEPVKPYADYDNVFDDEPGMEVIDVLHNENILILQKTYPGAVIACSSNHRHIFKAVRDSKGKVEEWQPAGFKVSFHYILNGYTSTVKDIGLTMETIHQQHSNWDISCYGRAQGFRIGSCHKYAHGGFSPDKDNPILMTFADDLDNHLIQALTGKEQQCATLYVPKEKPTHTGKDTDLERVLELLADNDIVHYGNAEQTDSGYRFPQKANKNKPRHCPVCEKKHTSNSFFINITPCQDVYYKCLSAKAANKTLRLGRLNPAIPEVSYMDDLAFNESRVKNDYNTGEPAPYDHTDKTKSVGYLAYMNRFFIHVDHHVNDVARIEYTIDGKRRDVVRRAIGEWEKSMKKVFSNWFYSGKARTAKLYRCLPHDNYDQENEINLMPPIASDDWDKELRVGDMALIEHHLWYVRNALSRGRDDVNEHLLKLMAYPLQTKKKACVLVLLRSVPGQLKSTFFGTGQGGRGTMLQIYGEAAGVITRMNQLLGENNAAYFKKYYIFGEEVGAFSGDKAANEALKTLIDCDLAQVGNKYEKAIPDCDDLRNYWFSCNGKDSISYRDNRKVWGLDIFFADKMLPDGVTTNPVWLEGVKRYGTAFCEPARNQAFYRYLMSLDLNGFVVDNFPVTKFQREMSKTQLPPMRSFVIALLSPYGLTLDDVYSNGEYVPCRYGVYKGKFSCSIGGAHWEYCSTKELWNAFVLWARQNNEAIKYLTKDALLGDITTDCNCDNAAEAVRQVKPKGDQRLTTVNFSTHPAYQHDTAPELTAAELPEEE